MKKNIILSLLFATSLFSCNMAKFYNYALPFTNVEKIISLNKGESVNEVNSKLGIQPYNVLHLSEDGSMVLTYHYRTQQRKLETKNFVQPDEKQAYLEGDEYQNGGKLVYVLDVEKVCVFFRNGRMVSYITTEGFKLSEFQLYFNYQIKLISEGKFEPFTAEKLRRFINDNTQGQNDRKQSSLFQRDENSSNEVAEKVEEKQSNSQKEVNKNTSGRNTKK